MPDVIASAVGILVFGLWLYCLFDVLTTEAALIRHLPRIAWFAIVLLLSALGSILWLCLGRPRIPTRRALPRVGARRPVPGSVPLFDGATETMHPIVREREERARLRMLEAQRRRRETESGGRGPGGSPGS